MTPRRNRRRPLLVARRLFAGAVAVAVVLAVATGWFVYDDFMGDLPPIDAAVDYQPPVTTQILAADGTLIGEFYSQKRYLVPLDRIPVHVRNAFIAAEDEAFYSHRGVDPSGIARAALNNLRPGSSTQGGSTITQQVVKSLLLSPEKTYSRKIKEMVLSLRLENALSKDEILGLYLNHIYLGSGSYGVAAAAHEYFGKEIEDVTVAEAALLAGLPQAPSKYSPYTHWPVAKTRQRYVLNRMYEAGFLERDGRDVALVEPIGLASRKGSFQAAPYFVEHVRRLLEERYGRTVLYELGLRVHTTVDVVMQVAAETALRQGIDSITERLGGFRNSYRRMSPEERDNYLQLQAQIYRGLEAPEPGFSYEAVVTSARATGARVQVGPFAGQLQLPADFGRKNTPLQLGDLIRVRALESDNGDPLTFEYDGGPLIEGALVALDPHTGHVRAMAGGYDFDRSHFNRAVQAKRQPGSAFKPLVYAAALDRHFTPASVIVDEPISYNDNGRVWAPQNFEKKFFGPTSLREALTKSRNVVTVRLAERVGIKYLIDYLPRFGLPAGLPRNLSIALGTTEVTPLELAVAYSTFASNGARPLPIFITEITDPQGQVLERTEPQRVQAIPPETAFMITSMLQDVVQRGTGTRAKGLKQPTAGKTGTTNDLEDAWFVGYTPQLLAAVWLGFDNKRPIGAKETGGKIAAPIWKTFMETALDGESAGEFAIPSGLKCVNVDSATGARASIPGASTRLECFRPGTEPPPGAVQLVKNPETEKHSEPSSLNFMRDDY